MVKAASPATVNLPALPASAMAARVAVARARSAPTRVPRAEPTVTVKAVLAKAAAPAKPPGPLAVASTAKPAGDDDWETF